MTRGAAHLLAYALLPVILFLAWLHPQTLQIGNIGWVINGGDWGQNTLGLAAYLRDGDWPGTMTPLIQAPNGIHLLMTDSNPLLGLLLKPFAGLLPPGVQFIGWWLLACLILHVFFARRLVGHYIDDRRAIWLGTVLLTLLPTLYGRLPHSNLCAHWLILWALWLFVDSSRSRSIPAWAALIGLAGLIHSYLLVMVGAIWASAMLRGLVTGGVGERWRVVRSTIVTALELMGLIVLHGLTDAPLSTTSYGAYPMPLDALINPGNPRYTALLPSSGAANGSDFGKVFEGFQYLGAGLLVLLAIALVVLWRRRDAPATHDERDLGDLRWLLPAFLALTSLAVSNLPIVHGSQYMIAALPLPLVDALDFVRASGRLFWPVAYTLVLVAIVVVGRLRYAVPILASALLIQVVDIAPMFSSLRDDSAQAAEPAVFRRLIDPRWDRLIASASQVDIQPPDDTRDRRLLEELGWRAVLADRPIRFMYVARVTLPAARRIAADRRAFLAGRIDPHRLYVLFPGEPLPLAGAGRTISIDGVTVIPSASGMTNDHRCSTPVAGKASQRCTAHIVYRILP